MQLQSETHLLIEEVDGISRDLVSVLPHPRLACRIKDVRRPQVARRVWARKDYIPDGGWPGQKWSTIEYDIHEHADMAPKGRDFGVKTRKVQLPAKLLRNREIVMNDHNSWVGIPGFYSFASVAGHR